MRTGGGGYVCGEEEVIKRKEKSRLGVPAVCPRVYPISGFIPGFIVPTLCRERKGWATRRIRGTNMLESGKMQEPKYHPSTDRSFTP